MTLLTPTPKRPSIPPAWARYHTLLHIPAAHSCTLYAVVVWKQYSEISPTAIAILAVTDNALDFWQVSDSDNDIDSDSNSALEKTSGQYSDYWYVCKCIVLVASGVTVNLDGSRGIDTKGP